MKNSSKTFTDNLSNVPLEANVFYVDIDFDSKNITDLRVYEVHSPSPNHNKETLFAVWNPSLGLVTSQVSKWERNIDLTGVNLLATSIAVSYFFAL